MAQVFRIRFLIRKTKQVDNRSVCWHKSYTSRLRWEVEIFPYPIDPCWIQVARRLWLHATRHFWVYRCATRTVRFLAFSLRQSIDTRMRWYYGNVFAKDRGRWSRPVLYFFTKLQNNMLIYKVVITLSVNREFIVRFKTSNLILNFNSNRYLLTVQMYKIKIYFHRKGCACKWIIINLLYFSH